MKYSNFISILVFVAVTIISCNNNYQPVINELRGEAQGTTFKILYLGEPVPNIESDVNQIFQDMDQSFSLWQNNSYINQINASDSVFGLNANSEHLCTLMNISAEVFNLTSGAFDPTIYPLVNAYGFGSGEPVLKPGFDLDSVMKMVGWERLTYTCEPFSITKPVGFKLDFNGIAQGYTVDILSDLLRQNNIENFMVEVGGELFAKGHNQLIKEWSVGIEQPTKVRSDTFQSIVSLDDEGMATSGSYRNFYEKDGLRFSHIIDPAKGIPVSHNLLSVTIKAPSATIADAIATACMVFGEEKSREFIEDNDTLEGLLIFQEDNDIKTWESHGFSSN